MTEAKLSTGTKRRTDIQGLRAIAIAAVVGYHYFPSRVSGGFVGVDVFFVISGFLITLLLLHEAADNGKISLPHFYAKRIRRLIPAVTVTTVATLTASVLILNPIELIAVLQDAAWSSAYLANYHFALDPDGYFAIRDASPFLHYWSLAVEEQYYLLWPLAIAGVLALTRKHWRVVLPVVLGVSFLSSAIASYVLTASGSNWAYYSLGTRAWELAIGGALAFVTFRGSYIPSKLAARAAGAVGLGCIVYSVFFFDNATPFPGAAALVPTLGTALLIWSSTKHHIFVNRLLDPRPVQFLGDISYSLYLWHWPVLILGTVVLGDDAASRSLLILVSIALSVASFYLIERRMNRSQKSPNEFAVIAAGAAATMALVSAAILVVSWIPLTGGPAAEIRPSASAEATLSGRTITLTDVGRIYAPATVPANLTPTLLKLPTDLAEVFTNGCFGTSLNVCQGGDPSSTTRVVLAGDSHAGQWWPAANQAAIDNGWKLYLVGKNGCALADVDISLGTTTAPWPECSEWQNLAANAVLDLNPDLIIYANNTLGYEAKASLQSGFESKWSLGVKSTLEKFTASSPVILFGQSPDLELDPGECLLDNLAAASKCEVSLEHAVPLEIRRLNESLAADSNALYFDPTSLLCTISCPVIDHNLLMYRDHSHLTRTYSLALSKEIATVINAGLGY